MSEQREVRARGSTPCLAGLSHAVLAKALEFTAHLVLTFPSPYQRIPFFYSQSIFPGPESQTASKPVGMQSLNIPTASISFSKSPDSSPRMLASMGFPVVFRYSSNTKPERERQGCQECPQGIENKRDFRKGGCSDQDWSAKMKGGLELWGAARRLCMSPATMQSSCLMPQGTVHPSCSNMKIGLVTRRKC